MEEIGGTEMVDERARWRRRILFAALGLGVLVLAYLALRPAAVEAELGEVTRGPMAEILREEGEARVRERFAISAPVAGRVLRNDLEVGDPVRAGDTVLATFVPSAPVPLDRRSREEAAAALEAAEAAIGRNRAEIGRLRAELEFAETELRRLQALAEQGIVSAEDLQRRELAQSSAQEALRAAEFAERSARSERRRAQARLMAASFDADLGETIEILSPIDGVVLSLLRESEAVVPVGEPLVEVGDPADLEIVVDYLSRDAVAIGPGQRVLIEEWGGPVLDGVVRIVEPTGFTKISALGVEEQRVNVRIDLLPQALEAAGGRLGDGYRVVAGAVVWESSEELRIPVGALFRRGDGWATYGLDDSGRIVELALEIGRQSSGTGGFAQVLSGVEQGRVVVLHPGMEVRAGRRVRSE
ncbi:MAG: HlyD family efflux transporter periplasmic adaptor subunit [Acidobacteria bacterium]|nr:MAG: HlyD family efflux transporter periplasmic adaptor subunit [Acidobacteriota bacterium]